MQIIKEKIESQISELKQEYETNNKALTKVLEQLEGKDQFRYMFLSGRQNQLESSIRDLEEILQ